MRRPTTSLSGLVTAIALIALTGGCFNSNDPVDTDPPPDAYPFPDTAEQLMTNFKDAYGGMNIDEYDNVLHEDFLFVFADGSPVAPTNGVYTREEDLQSTTRMFNGDQGQDEEGVVKPGVRDIEFTQLERQTDWEEVPGDDLHFAGARRALFDVRVVFYLNTESTNTITIDCQQLFYVTSVAEEQAGGGTRQHFYLIGQHDLDSK